MHNILVVDDELSIRESFSLVLEGKYNVLLAASGEAALKMIVDHKVDMVYLDIRMPGMDGLETLKRIKNLNPDLEVIMVTAVNEVQKASEAVRHAARDYVVKPFDINHILQLTEQILRKKSLLEQSGAVQKNSGHKSARLIGQSDKINAVANSLARIKKEELVLIVGEPGTEKETIARIIHENSPRAELSYKVAHLCPKMLPAKTMDMLFGRGKGESTVNLGVKSGVIEQAGQGSLFINNLEFLPQEAFNAFSSRSFSRIGSDASIPIEARLIGGTAAEPYGKNKKIFDLFSEICVQVPPLRERSSDIPLLVNYFNEEYGALHKKEIRISDAALDALANYSWPGNTHQLASLIERVILASRSGEVTLEDLPLDILMEGKTGTGSGFIQDFERQYIRSVFEQNNKNDEKTAVALGISPLLLKTKL